VGGGRARFLRWAPKGARKKKNKSTPLHIQVYRIEKARRRNVVFTGRRCFGGERKGGRTSPVVPKEKPWGEERSLEKASGIEGGGNVKSTSERG